MISLAPFRYRRCLSSEGGPISHIELARLDVEGRSEHHANAFLREGLVQQGPNRSVYSQADGSGTSEIAMFARHLAVSEALERWAHGHTLREKPAEYGFAVDPSSNGMAAYPGLSARSARHFARLEALERFCLIAWWDGKLDGIPIDENRVAGCNGVELFHPDRDAVTVVLHRRSGEGFHCYGSAAGDTFHEASRHAMVELCRAEAVLRIHFQAGRKEAEARPECVLERRLLFFSQEQGHCMFKEKCRVRPCESTASLRTVFDGPIPGPWGRYADVWRTVHEPTSLDFLSEREDVFFL